MNLTKISDNTKIIRDISNYSSKEEFFEDLKHIEIGELLEVARKYGRIRLNELNDHDFSFTITFDTIEHTTMEAKSGFTKSIEESIIYAIYNAKLICRQFKELNDLGY